MTDVRLTALNPVDSQVYPVACNTSGELLVADGGPDLTVTGDLTVDGTATIGGTALVTDANGNVGINTATPGKLLDVNGAAKISELNVGNPTGNVKIELGEGATQNRSVYIDLIADTTYSDYGLRIIRRNAGADAESEIMHRGTGSLRVNCQEAGKIELRTSNSTRATITSAGDLIMGGTEASPNISINRAGTATFTGNVTAPNITSLSAVIAELTAKVEILMSLNSRQVDNSTDTP